MAFTMTMSHKKPLVATPLIWASHTSHPSTLLAL
jgi:hypothetical protein